MNNDKRRLLELAGISLTEVSRRGFITGLGLGAVGGMASGASRSKQLEAVRQWFMFVHNNEGLNGVVGPFSSQDEAQTYTISMEKKLEFINADIGVVDGIDPTDFTELVDTEIQEYKKYEEQHKSRHKYKDQYRA